MKKARLAILASGRGSNAVSIIEKTKDEDFSAEVVLLVSDKRDAPVLEKARALGVNAIYLDPGPKKTFLLPEYEQRWVDVLKEHDVDYVLLAGFMRVLKKTFLDSFKGRVVNIHPSLLPAFPGLEAQRQAFEYGVKYSGATVHFVDDTLDAGPIILQEPVMVLDTDTPETLEERILETEHRIYPEAVKLLVRQQLKIEGRRVQVLKEEHGG